MATDERWRRVSDIFDRAIELDGADRALLLDAECGADDALRSEVVSLLSAHERAGILDRGVPVPPDSLREAVADALHERYIVEREIGRGGMATVFLAEERKHARRVVLKVLNPELAARSGSARFLREVAIIARLGHPNIVGLIDSGEAAGLLYYVMPYTEGETLRTRLGERGRLPLSEAVPLLRDIAAALAHAHRAGVAHCDLKPENVLLSGGHAYLLDFGIARLMEVRDPARSGTTREAIIGTPAYMAPEQLAGDPAADHRIDIHAWALVACEMVLGVVPPLGGVAETAQRLREPLRSLVSSAGAVDPAARPADGAALTAGLDRVAAVRRGSGWRRRAAVLAGAGIIAAGAFALRARRGPVASGEGPLPGPVAVMALANETGDPEAGPWGRMAADWLTQGLQETGLVTVVSWPSAHRASALVDAARAGEGSVDPVAMAREETGAGTVVTGGYYRDGDSLRFQIELTDATNGTLLAALPPVSAHRDAPQAGIEALRERLMGLVAIRADARLSLVSSPTQRPPTGRAYAAFDQGMRRYLDQEYPESAAEFRRAFALDSTFALALVYAATAYWNDDAYPEVDTMLRLLEPITPTLSPYHRLLIENVAAMMQGDVEGSLRALRRAAAIAPGARAGYSAGLVALMLGRTEEALADLEALDPNSGELRVWSSYWTQLAHARHLLGRHAAELDAARQLRRRFPDRRVGLTLEVRALAATGDTAAIDSVLAAAAALPPDTYWSQGAAMVVGAEDLVAHGHRDAGMALAERAAEWLAPRQSLGPSQPAHRYWYFGASYLLGRWSEARRIAETLVAGEPDNFGYRGLAALAAARLGDRAAERRLGPPVARERGVHLMMRARLAAVNGEGAKAAGLARSAVGAGVDGLAWVHSTGAADLRLLGPFIDSLPPVLRVSPLPAR